MTKALKTEASRITKILVENYKPGKVILFGSIARNEETKDSDLDFFIIKDTNKNFFERLFEAKKIIKSDKDVDLVIYNPQEFKDAVSNQTIFIRQVLNYGKTLYENGNYL